MNVLRAVVIAAGVTLGATQLPVAGEGVPAAGTVRSEAVPVTGTVRVARRGDQVETIRIDRGKEPAYNVVLDNNGRRLAEQNGKAVSVRGTVARRDGVDWVTVTQPPASAPSENARRRP